MTGPAELPIRSVGEWSFGSAQPYLSAFADVLVEGVFTSPSGRERVMPAFFDGDGTWRLRFNPGEAGTWTWTLRSRPHNPDFDRSGSFVATPSEGRGTLCATPGQGWGFAHEDGTPFLAFGDTTYHLIGMEYCGGDAKGFLDRRVSQGFNLFRVAVNMPAFHPPSAHYEWHDRVMWPWGGSVTSPRFDLFNLDWFQHFDRSIQHIETLGVGIEFVMEMMGFEFPFNHRAWFTAEWEELWLRNLVARYDAYNCVYFWTPLNEYEYYPNGDWHWTPTADRWAMRISRWIKDHAPHGHIVSAHNGPVLPPFAERFRADPEAIDGIMFQSWGARDRESGWLATGVGETIDAAFEGWRGGAIFAEWGYERNPALELKLPSHEFCDRNHTRRCAWAGVTRGMGIINGQENSWGPWMILDEDQPGVADLLILRRFLTEDVPFHTLRHAPGLARGDFALGHRPSALRSVDGDVAVIYFPAGGSADVDFAAARADWFDPRDGTTAPATARNGIYAAPSGLDETGRPVDHVLVLRT